MAVKTRASGLKDIFKALPGYFIAVAANPPEFTIIGVSEAVIEDFALDEGRVIENPLAEIFSGGVTPTGMKELGASLTKAVTTKSVQEAGDIGMSIGGKERRFRMSSCHPVIGSDGTVQGIILSLRDTVEDRIKMNTVQKDQTSLFVMADAIPHMSWIMDGSGRPIYYNNLWCEYADIPDNSLKDFDWSSVVHSDDRGRAMAEWQQAIAAGTLFETDLRLLNPSTKTYHWFASRAQPVRNARGEITQWFGTCTDIDEQKRAAQISAFIAQATKELGSSLDYAKTLETVTRLSVPEIADWCSVDLFNNHTGEWEQVALSHVDPSKLEMARRYRELHPIDPDAPFGVPAVVRSGMAEFHPYISDAALEEMVQTPEDLALAREFNVRAAIIVPIFIKDKAGGAITFVLSDSDRQYTISDLQMAEKLAGRISLSITNATVFKDAQEEIKRRHKLEKELRHEKDKLEMRVKARTKQLEDANAGLQAEIERRREVETELKRSNQELEDFAYVASHDLQEPLRKIQAFGDILESEYGDKLDDGAEYLKRMHSAAARMSRLIEDLLAFSRVTTRPPSPDKIDLNKIVFEVLGDLDDQIARTKGRVDVGTLPTVVADPTHMRQLFQNLISNALKFHRDDVTPVVTVASHPCKDADCPNFEITVTDNGIGFDQKYVDRIFGVFQRLHGRDSYEGTGIGLAVCRKIVEQYGGTISAESQKGNGAKFTIRIPAVAKEIKRD